MSFAGMRNSMASGSDREGMKEVLAARRAGDVTRLVHLTDDPEQTSDIRSFAARSLGKLRNPLAVDSLIAVIDDANFDVRAAAIVSLRKIGDGRAAQPLATRLRHRTEHGGIGVLMNAVRELHRRCRDRDLAEGSPGTWGPASAGRCGAHRQQSQSACAQGALARR